MKSDEMHQDLQDMYEDEQTEWQLICPCHPIKLELAGPGDTALDNEHEPWKGSGKRKMRKTK